MSNSFVAPVPRKSDARGEQLKTPLLASDYQGAINGDALQGTKSSRGGGYAEESGVQQMQVETSPGGYRDIVWAILFWLNMGVYVSLLVAAFVRNVQLKSFVFDGEMYKPSSYYPPPGAPPLQSPHLALHATLVLSGFIVLAAALAYAALRLAFFTPKWTGIGGLSFCMLYAVALSVYGFMVGSVAVGVCALLLVVVFLFTALNFMRFIKFAELLVFTTRDVAAEHSGVYGVAVAAILVNGAWLAINMLITVPALVYCFNGPHLIKETWMQVLVGTYALFTFYWVSEVIYTVLHVSVCGSTATWFFSSDLWRPRNPTLGAVRRAVTFSFGSICLGAALIAFLQTLRRLLSMARNTRSKNVFVLALACLAYVFLYVIEAILRFLNKYVYVIIAIDGSSYCEAMRKTRDLLGEHGFEMVMQNNIIVVIAFAAAMFNGCLCAFGAYACCAWLLQLSVLPTIVLVSCVAIVALLVTNAAFVVLDSGSTTLMMSYFLRPEVLQNKRPQLFAALKRAHEVAIRS